MVGSAARMRVLSVTRPSFTGQLKSTRTSARLPSTAPASKDRAQIRQQISQLAAEREAYIAEKAEEADGFKDSLDQKIYDVVSRQAEAAGFEYAEGPEY
jgi:hypothetical protein